MEFESRAVVSSITHGAAAATQRARRGATRVPASHRVKADAGGDAGDSRFTVRWVGIGLLCTLVFVLAAVLSLDEDSVSNARSLSSQDSSSEWSAAVPNKKRGQRTMPDKTAAIGKRLQRPQPQPPQRDKRLPALRGQRRGTTSPEPVGVPPPDAVDDDGGPGTLRFALVPRPAILQQKRWPRKVSRHIALPERAPVTEDTPNLIWDAGPYASTDARLLSSLRAYEDIFGQAFVLNATPPVPTPHPSAGKKTVKDDGHPVTTTSPAHALSAELAADRAGEGRVAVILRGDLVQARNGCRVAARLQKPGSSDASQQEEYVPRSSQAEWHFAVHRGGRIVVCAKDPEGAFRFLATLRQMTHGTLRMPPAAKSSTEKWLSTSEKNLLVPGKDNFILEDWPRHGWRALQLDAVRHFMPVPFLKRYLGAMASYKANVFQWHLADDQAWRVFLPSRPKLVNASATPEYYTAEDIKEVVDFASNLFITVMPVIETPGHVLTALAAYPELACSGTHFEVPKVRTMIYKEMMCVGKATTAQFARDIFTDLAKLFPGPYVHIGGDEIETVRWESSPHVKSFAGMAGLKNLGPDILEAWYCHVGQLLKSLNRTPVMWDDHFKDRPYSVTRKCPGAEDDWIVQAWKLIGDVGNEYSISERFAFRSVATPMKSVYLDYPVASIDFNKTLAWDLGRGRVLGGAALMWTEDSPPEAVGAKVYPRYLGIADRLWGAVPPKKRRRLDMQPYEAAHAHCAPESPLLKVFNYSCGRFELRLGERAPIWKDAQVKTNLDSFDKAFSWERALDGEMDTFFWAISPNLGDYMQVRWPLKTAPVGHWLRSARVYTGTADRPGDRMDYGELRAAMWLPNTPDADEPRTCDLHWVKLATFVEGNAEADQEALAKGPISALYIMSTKRQEKWMAMPEITVELSKGLEYPTEEEAHYPKEVFWTSGGSKAMGLQELKAWSPWPAIGGGLDKTAPASDYDTAAPTSAGTVAPTTRPTSASMPAAMITEISSVVSSLELESAASTRPSAGQPQKTMLQGHAGSATPVATMQMAAATPLETEIAATTPKGAAVVSEATPMHAATPPPGPPPATPPAVPVPAMKAGGSPTGPPASLADAPMMAHAAAATSDFNATAESPPSLPSQAYLLSSVSADDAPQANLSSAVDADSQTLSAVGGDAENAIGADAAPGDIEESEDVAVDAEDETVVDAIASDTEESEAPVASGVVPSAESI